ncbi:MAG: aspartate kinase [Bacteroidia bacterium]|nr:aspartate kinase [Bacteroidia bacterium]
MKVFKFGGASVKDASGVKNIAKILFKYSDSKIVVVISAMGKTTNALEKVLNDYFNKNKNILDSLNSIKDYHINIIDNLFETDLKETTKKDILEIFNKITNYLRINFEPENYDYEYDKLISWGEVISTKIIHSYLLEQKINSKWVDARELIKTNNNYRNAAINWETTCNNCKQQIVESFKNYDIIITQGFIGSDNQNNVTTLGREGSDFTAGIIAHAIEANDVTIWKDVPGLLNADPKWFDDTVKLNNISYHEAIELAYYGATVIHPKTIQPIKNKNIPLYVKSFLNPEEDGSVINNNSSQDSKIPSFIFRVNQILLSISSKDYTFIVEENLSAIFGLFASHKVSINLMENSSISFSVVVDYDERKIKPLIKELQKDYKVLYNTNVELATIRNYDQKTIERVTSNKKIFISQQSRKTVRFVMKDK